MSIQDFSNVFHGLQRQRIRAKWRFKERQYPLVVPHIATVSNKCRHDSACIDP
jgi:hypothetical protein